MEKKNILTSRTRSAKHPFFWYDPQLEFFFIPNNPLFFFSLPPLFALVDDSVRSIYAGRGKEAGDAEGIGDV